MDRKGQKTGCAGHANLRSARVDCNLANEKLFSISEVPTHFLERKSVTSHGSLQYCRKTRTRKPNRKISSAKIASKEKDKKISFLPNQSLPKISKFNCPLCQPKSVPKSTGICLKFYNLSLWFNWLTNRHASFIFRILFRFYFGCQQVLTWEKYD